jgi:hypothetical protein
MTKPLRAADAVGTLVAIAAVIVVSGVETGASARWRPVARADTYTSPDAYEVSCRVRVGEVTRPGMPGFTPRDGSRKGGSPASAVWIGTSRGKVAELGVPARESPVWGTASTLNAPKIRER